MPVADISVTFPYYNESETLRTTLDLISRQTLMPREVFFVNSSSTDDSSRIIDDWITENQDRFETRFHNIFEGTDTPSSSKNVGIKRSASTWVAFMDCGLTFGTDWLQKQWDYVHTHPEEDLVSGGCILTGEGIIDMSAVAQTYGYKNFRPTVPTTLVKRSVFDRTGLFLENRRAGYDFAWPLLLSKLGVKRGINESVVIRYIGVNYGDSLAHIFRKSITYAVPTVGIPYYRIPYYYLVALAVLLCSCVWRPASFVFFLAAYILFRGYLYPLKKSNNFALIREHKLALLTLPLLGIVIDAGRILGIIKGTGLLAGSRLVGMVSGIHAKALVKGLAWIGVLYGLAKVSTLLTQVVAGRWLGPHHFGQANLVIALAAYLQILPMMGFPMALSKFLSSESDENRRRMIISSTFFAFLAWAAFCAALLGLGRGFIIRHVGITPPFFKQALLFSFCTAFYVVVSSPLLGIQRFERRGLAEIIYGSLAPLFLVGFMLAGYKTHLSLILTLSLSLIGASLYSLWSLRGYIKPVFDLAVLKPIFPYAVIAAINILAAACVMAPARIILHRYGSSWEIGIFSAYFTATSQICLALLYMVTAVVVPLASSPEGQRETWAAFKKISIPLWLGSWATFVLTAAVALSLFGRQYPYHWEWAILFAGASGLMLVHGITSSLYAARDFSGLCISVAGSLIAGFCNIGLCLALIPKWGITGSAISLLGAHLMGLAFYTGCARIVHSTP